MPQQSAPSPERIGTADGCGRERRIALPYVASLLTVRLDVEVVRYRTEPGIDSPLLLLFAAGTVIVGAWRPSAHGVSPDDDSADDGIKRAGDVAASVFYTEVVLFHRFVRFPNSDRPLKPTRYDRAMESTISQECRHENSNQPDRRQNYSITKKEKQTMQNDHASQRTRPAVTIGGPEFIVRYDDGVLHLRLKEEPDRDIACIDADSFVKLPYVLPLVYECLEKDVTLSEETRHRAGQMARRMRYAIQMRIPPRFSGEGVAKKTAELFSSEQAIDEPGVTISREGRKSLLAHCWEYAEEDFILTPFEDRARHIFPMMAQLLELVAGRNEQLCEFVDDCLSEEVPMQVTQGVRDISA